MIRSSGSLRERTRLQADVCVIGAGPAGLALARELAGTASVCVLESGGHAVVEHPDRDPLYELRYSRDRVSRESRVRAFGGTTKVWSGRWKRFDAIDLAVRDWVPRSGWPIEHAALAPFYDRAARLAGIDERLGSGTEARLLDGDVVVPTVFHTQAEAARDWGQALAPALASANRLDVVLDAHVVGIDRRGVRARNGDLHFDVDARFIVLAAGGIENARLLLLSSLGNERDQVGRCYMDHPKAKIGAVETYAPLAISSWHGWSEDDPSYTGFRLADAVQRAERTLNSHVFLAPLFETDLPRRLARRVRSPRECRVLAVRNYLEQEPDPENRVMLCDELDPYGQPRALVQWSVGERDLATLRVFHRMLARELQRAGVGELHSPLLHDRPTPEFVDASHHIGTTRMGRDPATSVVDANCRLHEVDNIYVAGSSVFPTSGYANPTATIVALALRLADHLRARL